ncbi:sulfite reductase subunit alpha (plasmid) [Methylocystis sp. MJC1]|jgi:sulfite reductase (NADPH) flavoprotein alpha-component|uniref:sulfite reductase subunit alpha n=1 Tax=Methylocystis sp. MJC1 TaxID=2654282 RepID=UPI0013ED8251|nr:sulfite reductase subunit alpha [Methylocystis sp. MJC1]KAF2989090.1 Sulfite reductase [NADPH] flavoprotein alpha-component [Methylocystis sp. MJC1]MBU6529131.1 sulfite reductase subunit alpha [Methylocystis sp. MJC1]UZX14065.1 sulfite reductase subunit alpha [Methylocystis sp. MJC1]
MNHIAPPQSLIPESAPFSPEQRAWLNGFFVALVAPDNALVTPLSPQANAAVMPAPVEDDGEAPWHDQTLALDDRMALAEGRPLRRRMMAAMAQQDCGQCGYNCASYADALVARKEARLNLCAPGGKETARMLKSLAAELEEPSKRTTPRPSEPAITSLAAGRSRDNPAPATFLSRRRLNGEGSAKETWHVEFDLRESALDYKAGDSFGVFAKNELGLVDQIIAMLGASHLTPVRGKTLREVLQCDVSLSPAPDTLFELISFVTGGAQREKARLLAHGDDPDGDAATLDALAVLQKFPSARPHPEAFVEALEPLQPRLYSISSSPNATPRRLSLTVDAVRYVVGKRKRLGVASTFLAERIAPGETLMAYVQPAHGFSLPDDPETPIVMVGPGTGVAPFRAFLQERAAKGAKGKNWLFFGHQRAACDFFYADEFETMKAAGLLTRLSLAWSRDGQEKFYVQDRMRQSGRELWAWLAEGAHFYVCGDAQRMAKDVERALVDVVSEFGARSVDEAIAFVNGLKKSGRYQQDVY